MAQSGNKKYRGVAKWGPGVRATDATGESRPKKLGLQQTDPSEVVRFAGKFSCRLVSLVFPNRVHSHCGHFPIHSLMYFS